MKTIIILGALVISTGTFAQGRAEMVKAEKEIGSAQTEIKEQVDKGQKDVKEKLGQSKKEIDKIKAKGDAIGKDAKDEAKEKSNNGNAYGKDKLGKEGKEFGQHRAAEAKLKAKQVKTKAAADEMIRTSKEETKETVTSIDTKMIAARTKLTEKLASGEIKQAEFDEKIKQLMDFEKRKNSIIEEMK